MPIVLSKRAGGGGGSSAPSGPAGGSLAGTYPDPTIAAGAVDTAELANDAVDNDKIANNAVDTPQLVDDSVDADKIDGADAGDIRVVLGVAGADGWVDDQAATWTRTADQTFTVTGDRTTVFTKGTRLRWTQTTVKYGVVTGSSHAAGTTTVTIATNTDYVLTAAAISLNYYSYAVNPQGYPTWFNYTPVYTGFSAAPALGGGYIQFQVLGSSCCVAHVPFTNGTSDATGFTITLPITAALTSVGQGGRAMNNSALTTTPGMVSISGGSGTATMQRDYSGATWTASNNKNMQFTIWYTI